MQRVVKPTTHKTKRILQNKEPKIIENVKQTLFIRGRTAHENVLNCMKEFYLLKKPDAVMFSEKHDILPFEDVVPLEKLLDKYDCSLFVLGTHNKKRPDNLIIGRTFNKTVLDMFELGIESYQGFSAFKATPPSFGVRPGIVFMGEEFETVHILKRLQNVFVDLFHGKTTKLVNLGSMEFVYTFACVNNKIMMRTYKVKQTKVVGDVVPQIDLEPLGPFVNFMLRRHMLASDDLFKSACKKPKTKGKKIKNIKRDAFGNKLGRVHMGSQDVNRLQTRKMKGLKKNLSEKINNKKQEKKRKQKRKRKSNRK